MVEKVLANINSKDSQEIDPRLKPLLAAVKRLQATVADNYPHWLSGEHPQGRMNDTRLKERYVRLNGLLEETIGEINDGLTNNNSLALAEAARKLFEKNKDPNYFILVGENPQLLSQDTTNNLGLACAERLLSRNSQPLESALISASTDILDRMDIYINPDR